MTLFEANYRFNLQIYQMPRDSTVESNRTLITESKACRIEVKLRENLTHVQERIRKYYNLKRSKGLTLKKGNKVYLSFKNFNLKRLSRKLDFYK